jgi:Ser/Thr protein kinase RdoA (MazF antagonist)
MTSIAADRVLAAARPAFTNQEAATIARETFGVIGNAVEVESERDQTFLIDGLHPAVLKISNAAEDPAQLDLEASAAQRVAEIDPGLPVALPAPLPHQPGTYRAAVVRNEQTHWVRMYDRLPGDASVRGSSLSDQSIREWGAMAARVGRALRGFWHPAAARVMLWDAQHALLLRPMLDVITDPDVRGLVERALDRFEREVGPILPTCATR